MDILEFMIPGGIILGLVGLFFFFWTIRSSQYDDLDGAAQRILLEDDNDAIPEKSENP
jgi:cbb3-type cytochrome oxidase maturation protein